MKNKFCCALFLIASVAGFAPQIHAGKPTDPADPRPDFLPHHFYYNHDSYRKTYNRPRFVAGYLGSKFEPTSQEAVSWKDSYCAGMYGTHCRTPVPFYYYPKPWEALDVGPRRDSRIVPSKNEPTRESDAINGESGKSEQPEK